MKPKTQFPICEHCGFDERRQNENHQLPIGTLLQNQYIVGRVLGQGGFGITYIGWDRNLAIPVAIKEFFPNGTVHRQSTINLGVTCYTGSASDAFANHRDRFLKEARTLAQLSGVPEIVQVRNFFSANNTAYIVMEYVQGITLKTKLRQLGRRMTVQEVLDVMEPVLKALSKVHAKNLIHRDISPDNIMLPTGGGVKLIDFGTVRATDNGMQTKSTESIMKPGFAPIEQYQTRGNLGTWTDVYALSATFHYCLTGKIPEDALERLENGGKLVHLQNLPGMTPRMLSVLEKGLAVRIADRIQTVDQMYQMLYENAGASAAGTYTVPQKPVTPVNIPVYAADDGTIFGRFRGQVPDFVVEYCEANASHPVLVDVYLKQAIKSNRITEAQCSSMLSHYNAYMAARNSQPKTPPAQPVRPVTQTPHTGSAQTGSMIHCTECGKQIAENSKFCCYCGSVMQPVLNANIRWYCNHCKSQIPVSSKYCRSCGTRVLSPVVKNVNEKRCHRCGTPLLENNKFCHSCGTPVQQAQVSKYPKGHCQFCGKKLNSSAKFCFFCGKSVNG